MWGLAILILLAIAAAVSSFVVRHPEISELLTRDETTVFVKDSSYLRRTIELYKDRLIIFYVARLKNGQPFYLFNSNYERLVETFRGYRVVHFVLGLRMDEDSPLIAEAISYLPENTLFVLNGEPLQYDVCCLAQFRATVGFGPPVIFQTDNELSWVDPDLEAGIFSNQTLCYNSNIPEVYKSYKYVFRTNYYRPLIEMENVQYVPLGSAAARYTRLFAETHPMVKASERLMWCMFSGRLEYQYVTKYHDDRGRLVSAINSDEMNVDSDVKTCRMLTGEANIFRQYLDHDDYLLLMSQVAFAPCPSGNNPETFRHYEAMTLGAVPLLVRNPNSDEDFTRDWIDYPGPFFNNWLDALHFARDVSASDADVLQAAIFQWNVQYMFERKMKLIDTIRGLFNNLI